VIDLIFKREKPRGRPRVGSSAAIKAVAGACLELFMQRNLNEDEAAKVIVRKLKEHGIKYTNNGEVGPASIDAKQVKRWRHDLRATKVRSKAKCIFETMLSDRSRLPQMLTLQQASALVDEGIRCLQHFGY
jgi:hypothetical protein